MALAAANAVAMHSGDRGSSSRQALSSFQASLSRQASGGGGVQTRFVTIVRKMHSGWTGVKLVIAALLSFFLFLGVVFCRFKVDILSSRACQVVDWSLESNVMSLPLSLPFSPLTRALESIVPQRSSRYVSLGHLGCTRKSDSPAVLYSAAKDSLPSLLGGGNGSTHLPPLPDSGASSDGLGDEGDRRTADGKIHNYAGLDS